MSVTRETVAKIASLARIRMDDAALDRMVPEFDAILDWVEQLGEVDTSGVEPMTAVIENHLRLRDDVVDDGDCGITDIVRGADLLDSTARQIYLQRLLGLPTPRYMHVPVLVNERGEKLSKQTGAAALEDGEPKANL